MDVVIPGKKVISEITGDVDREMTEHVGVTLDVAYLDWLRDDPLFSGAQLRINARTFSSGQHNLRMVTTLTEEFC